jgi:hypothetical protein
VAWAAFESRGKLKPAAAANVEFLINDLLLMAMFSFLKDANN